MQSQIGLDQLQIWRRMTLWRSLSDLEFPLNLGPCAKPLAQVDVARAHLSTGLPDVRARPPPFLSVGSLQQERGHLVSEFQVCVDDQRSRSGLEGEAADQLSQQCIKESNSQCFDLLPSMLSCGQLPSGSQQERGHLVSEFQVCVDDQRSRSGLEETAAGRLVEGGRQRISLVNSV
jgi:hypothetical protein